MNLPEGWKSLEIPDTDKEISRMVAKEALIAAVRDEMCNHGLSSTEMTEILKEIHIMFQRSTESNKKG